MCVRECACVCACVSVCVCVCVNVSHLRRALSVTVVAVRRHDDVRVGRSQVADVVGHADARSATPTAVHGLLGHGFVERTAVAQAAAAESWGFTRGGGKTDGYLMHTNPFPPQLIY